MKENKRRALEKKYSEVLRQAGIDDLDKFESEVNVARAVTSESVNGANPGADDWVNEPWGLIYLTLTLSLSF